jgi:hypothetical protein
VTTAAMFEEIRRLREECARLQRFKDYCHARLDAAGVPVDPESAHRAAGCRIGGRLDLVLDVWAHAREAVPAAIDENFDRGAG